MTPVIEYKSPIHNIFCGKFYRHIHGKDEKPKNISLSLTILTNLCHANYSVTTFVLNLISLEERKGLIVQHNDDPVLQVRIHIEAEGSKNDLDPS